MHANALRLTFHVRNADISLGDIHEVKLEEGRFWGSIRIHHAAGKDTLSGLSRTGARRFADRLHEARVEWWRHAVSEQIGPIRSVHARVAELEDPPRYLGRIFIRALVKDARMATTEFAHGWPETLSDTPEIGMLRDIRAFLEDPDRAREKANEVFVEKELVESRALFDRIEARPLTEEQRRAVVIDDHRNLVVAAAGSGKTSVIAAKAGWLIRRGFRRPSELLLLAFTRSARKEMEERLYRRLGADAASGVAVRTFHGLGTSIIGQAEGRRPSLARVAEDGNALTDQIKDIMVELLDDRKFSRILRKWFQEMSTPYRSVHEFDCPGEYHDYMRKHEIRSLQGEKVKSCEECEIANFLHLNGIGYRYEADYEHDTATPEKRQYKPDFHLPDHGIYIEHFGIDKEGNTAPYVDRDRYLNSMKWKRELHARHGTVLIETFSHENTDGGLLSNLAEKLAARGIALSPIPDDQVFAVLEKQGRIDLFTRLVVTFLHHFKSNRLSFSDLHDLAGGQSDPGRATAFLSVFRPICEHYQKHLDDAGEIDFHDMISRAAILVELGRYRSPYGYILVDEFQDISPGRARLLKALLDMSSSNQMFVVGDDWQAIYRFAGSDMAVMRKFEEYFGEFHRSDLGITFRCSDRITETANRFLLRNPEQIRKTVRAIRKVDRPGVHIGFSRRNDNFLSKEVLDRIAEDSGRYDGKSDVLVLGRYRHLRPGNLVELNRRFSSLAFSWKTIHGSKGLEADYVIVVGLCSGKYGFPSEIEDDPLLRLVLGNPECHPNAEERRLLYVALTRARRHAYLLAEGGRRSSFITELLESGNDIGVFGLPPEADVACPRCITGRMERRENSQDRSVFYGCSNHPYCEKTLPSCSSCRTGLPVGSDGGFHCSECGAMIDDCPLCNGWLGTRKGRYGIFVGCSNWPRCDYARAPGGTAAARERCRLPSEKRERGTGGRMIDDLRS